MSWIEDQFARYTYKPGYKLSLRSNHNLMTEETMWAIQIKYTAVDARNPQCMVPLTARYIIPIDIIGEENPELFAFWLQNLLFDIEMHESREWLRQDGKIYDDPHVRDSLV